MGAAGIFELNFVRRFTTETRRHRGNLNRMDKIFRIILISFRVPRLKISVSLVSLW